MKQFRAIFMTFILLFSITACGKQNNNSAMKPPMSKDSKMTDNSFGSYKKEVTASFSSESIESETGTRMKIEVNGQLFTAALADNETARALIDKMANGPMVIHMRDYGGFEKVGDLGTSLPASDRPMTTRAGDLVLYNGNQIVLFYGSNSWNYTRIGTIDDVEGIKAALGTGDVTITFFIN